MILNRRVPILERPYLLRPGVAYDSDGDLVESWDHPAAFELPRGSQVQDRDSVEEDGAVKRLTTSQRVLFVPTIFGDYVLVHENDRIKVGSELWRVEGRPSVHRGLRGAEYTTAILRRIEGG